LDLPVCYHEIASATVEVAVDFEALLPQEKLEINFDAINTLLESIDLSGLSKFC